MFSELLADARANKLTAELKVSSLEEELNKTKKNQSDCMRLTTAEEEITRSRTNFGEQLTEFRLKEDVLKKTILSLESRNEG